MPIAVKTLNTSSTSTSNSITLPDPPGLNDNPGFSRIRIKKIVADDYVASGAYISLNVQWYDPVALAFVSVRIAQSITTAAASKVAVSSPWVDMPLLIPAGCTTVSVNTLSSGAGQAHNGSNGSTSANIFVEYEHCSQ